MSARVKRSLAVSALLAGLAVASISLLTAFDPFSETNPEPLPTSVTEAEVYINELVYAHVGQYPDSVDCVEVYKLSHYVYVCDVSKVGYETQVMGVDKGN